ncbi:hypothetical protein M5D96_011309, partial [Drosophila gunungcola]
SCICKIHSQLLLSFGQALEIYGVFCISRAAIALKLLPPSAAGNCLSIYAMEVINLCPACLFIRRPALKAWSLCNRSCCQLAVALTQFLQSAQDGTLWPLPFRYFCS